jgi:hypothetical protein
LNAFEKFVAENVDGLEKSKREHVILLPRELSNAFEHWCRKRNLGFSQGVAVLIQDALENEKKRIREEEEKPRPNPNMFMQDAF